MVELLTPPPLPEGFAFNGAVYDIETTASFAPPVTVCFQGSFGVGDRLWHYEGGQFRSDGPKVQ